MRVQIPPAVPDVNCSSDTFRTVFVIYEVVKFEQDNLILDVNVSPNEDTVWLSKEDMSTLFDRDRSVITKHINNIYKEGELDRESTCAKNAHVRLEGSRTITRTIEF